HRLFAPDPHSLATKIQAGLADQLPPLAKRYSVEDSARRWSEFCEILLSPPSEQRPDSAPSGRVRVLLHADQSPEDFDRALDCLLRQTRQNFTVTILTEPAANGLAVSWERARTKYRRPGWRFVELSVTNELESANIAGN